MRDVELYQTILGLSEPWSVGRVELDVDGQRVDIWVDHGPAVRWPCPECGEPVPDESVEVDLTPPPSP
jgi:transposase